MTLLSIIIPVYQDWENLERLVSEISEKGLEDTEVIIGATEARKVKKGKLPCRIVLSGKGRAQQMNAAAKKAKGKFLWFVHADSSIERINFNTLFKRIKLMEHGVLSFRIRYDSGRRYFRFIEYLAYFRQRHGHIWGDQGILVASSLFREMEGYSHARFEDMEFSKRLRKLKVRMFVSDQVIVSSPRRFLKHGVCYTHFIMGMIVVSEGLGMKRLSTWLYGLI